MAGVKFDFRASLLFKNQIFKFLSAAGAMKSLVRRSAPASWRRGKPDALLHHSDRGSQYTSEQFQRLMADNGVVCSMSRSFA
jgi:putative transposase